MKPASNPELALFLPEGAAHDDGHFQEAALCRPGLTFCHFKIPTALQGRPFGSILQVRNLRRGEVKCSKAHNSLGTELGSGLVCLISCPFCSWLHRAELRGTVQALTRRMGSPGGQRPLLPTDGWSRAGRWGKVWKSFLEEVTF